MNDSMLLGEAIASADLADAVVAFLHTEGTLITLPANLGTLSLNQLIAVVDRAGAERNRRATIAVYEAWIARQPPGDGNLFVAWYNLGFELTGVGETNSAIIAYRNALTLRPGFHAAAVNLGLQLELTGRTDLALQTWEQATQSNVERVTLINQQARLLEQLNRLDQAEAEMRRSLLTDPQQPDVVQHWVHVRQKMCKWPILTDEIPGLSAADLLRQAGPLSVMALSDDIAVQRESGCNWIARKTTATPIRLSPPEGYRHQRIRVGYLSSDFCRHAMSYLITELLEQHDRNDFEIYGYCSSREDGSDIRARIIKSFDHFTLIGGLTDEQAARAIRQAEIDILVDLNGLTTGARAQVLRWKPAPIQATYLGFVGPVPLPELDYMFCDAGVVPPETAAAYAPKPLYIANVYQANDTKRFVGVPTTRAAVGLPEDRFVLCCFSNTYKITEQLFAAWMEILRRTEDSVLWLPADNEWATANMTVRAAEAGVDPSRLIFTPRVGPADYMARMPLGNLFLDTFPYNAGTVASDAIRMGLPLLTVSGSSFAARMAGRLLTAAGATEGIARDLQEYVEMGVALASNRTAYTAYRQRLSGDTWNRRIGNIAIFTRDYEKALRSIVQPDLALSSVEA